MAKMSGQVCLNHTDREAVTRCETCFKPLCEECILSANDVDFCSGDCAGNYSDSAERMSGQADRARKARARKRMKRLVILVVLGALAYCGYRWAVANPDRTRELRRELEEKAKSVK
ncbi:MAG: hypothetical protein HN742_40445 [Lentisphaerae bacterium]|jgi:hypothetical protein|nr:hypothetical protein [Lentisphaerota bacterium]MBT4815713.1 hypothetical protein [Lentisphaerota bacterium]MBT5610285.1 hypothetical protein [Lentisphaerota bacterium]MBT7059187.1 hypothetical protein [Lentisphaerota bacterium]MBT7848205.1 hypothetical protein [Lentisphaerota bacterium]